MGRGIGGGFGGVWGGRAGRRPNRPEDDFGGRSPPVPAEPERPAAVSCGGQGAAEKKKSPHGKAMQGWWLLLLPGGEDIHLGDAGQG